MNKKLYKWLFAIGLIIGLILSWIFGVPYIKGKFYPNFEQMVGTAIKEAGITSITEIDTCKKLGAIDVSKPFSKDNEKLKAFISSLESGKRELIYIYRTEENGKTAIYFVLSSASNSEQNTWSKRYLDTNMTEYGYFADSYTKESDGIVSVYLRATDKDKPDLLLYSYHK